MSGRMMPARPRPKNDSATETQRVLRVLDILHEELIRRGFSMVVTPDRVLEIANSIAARTEDPV